MHSAETADFCMLIPLKPTVTDTMSSSVYTKRTHVQARPVLTPRVYFGEHDRAAVCFRRTQRWRYGAAPLSYSSVSGAYVHISLFYNET